MDTGLLVLRVIVGLLLVSRGAQKLFGWFGGGGLAATAWFFRSVGYWPPRLLAGFVGGIELVGGAALAVGLGTPLAAAAVIATTLNAAVAVHKRNDLLAVDGGYEYPLLMATAAATLGFTGAGDASLDATLALVDGGVEPGLFAVVLGLVAGSGVLLSRVAARSRHSHSASWSARKSPPDVVRSHAAPSSTTSQVVAGGRRQGGLQQRKGLVFRRAQKGQGCRQRRAHRRNGNIRRIVVGVDGSEDAARPCGGPPG